MKNGCVLIKTPNIDHFSTTMRYDVSSVRTNAEYKILLLRRFFPQFSSSPTTYKSIYHFLLGNFYFHCWFATTM